MVGKAVARAEAERAVATAAVTAVEERAAVWEEGTAVAVTAVAKAVVAMVEGHAGIVAKIWPQFS
eukprot:867405-Prymnesium_polylepis.1